MVVTLRLSTIDELYNDLTSVSHAFFLAIPVKQ
jgi:hypothetical protein